MMHAPPVILWFRYDLRLSDNPAFQHALMGRRPIIAIYIWSPEEEGKWKVGAASRWWLHHSLTALQKELNAKGIDLIIQRGIAAEIIKKIVLAAGVGEVIWNARYEPHAILQENKVKAALKSTQCRPVIFHGNLLFSPSLVLTGKGTHYQMFTPFYHACLRSEVTLIPEDKALPIIPFHLKEKSLKINDLHLLPTQGWDQGFYRAWHPGERGAKRLLNQFIKNSLSDYPRSRDLPGVDGTSLLSPHLHFGEIAPHSIWKTLSRNKHAGPFLRQLVWREFAHHLLIHFPHTPVYPLKEKFKTFPWKNNSALLKKWQQGMTGFPLIDAGMRQLWKTGWMHNRVRMIVASFLVKDLMIPWQKGAQWFWDTLLDADLANNTLGWQWCAGCGADAAPYFRIFNPFTQSKRFDPEGEYIRRYIPELKQLPNRWIHAPHLAPLEILDKAQVILGKTYPYPLVDHDAARKEALRLFHRWNSA